MPFHQLSCAHICQNSNISRWQHLQIAHFLICLLLFHIATNKKDPNMVISINGLIFGWFRPISSLVYPLFCPMIKYFWHLISAPFCTFLSPNMKMPIPKGLTHGCWAELLQWQPGWFVERKRKSGKVSMVAAISYLLPLFFSQNCYNK